MPSLARSVPKPLKVPSLARSVPKHLKVPSLARSVLKPLNWEGKKKRRKSAKGISPTFLRHQEYMTAPLKKKRRKKKKDKRKKKRKKKEKNI